MQSAPDARTAVLWLADVTADDFDSVGGKGTSLGELTAAGLPVLPDFIVSVDPYRSFLEEPGVDEELFAAIYFESGDSEPLARTAEYARELIRAAEMLESTRSSILAAYDDLDDGAASVAVRSSATAEDLPDTCLADPLETSNAHSYERRAPRSLFLLRYSGHADITGKTSHDRFHSYYCNQR